MCNSLNWLSIKYRKLCSTSNWLDIKMTEIGNEFPEFHKRPVFDDLIVGDKKITLFQALSTVSI